MSGLTIRQILMATNYWVTVKIVSEFGKVLKSTRIVMDMLSDLTDEQLDTKFDYLSTSDYNSEETNVLIIGLNENTKF